MAAELQSRRGVVGGCWVELGCAMLELGGWWNWVAAEWQSLRRVVGGCWVELGGCAVVDLGGWWNWVAVSRRGGVVGCWVVVQW